MSDMNSSSFTPSIHKQRAPADIEQKTAGWETWHCNSEKFEHRYVPGATFYVVQGRAKLTFSHGVELALETGYYVSIGEGAQAVWDISAPVETRYMFHKNVDAATGA